MPINCLFRCNSALRTEKCPIKKYIVRISANQSTGVVSHPEVTMVHGVVLRLPQGRHAQILVMIQVASGPISTRFSDIQRMADSDSGVHPAEVQEWNDAM
jgi:hypothetical protein